jgi:signal transduction histidine kinase
MVYDRPPSEADARLKTREHVLALLSHEMRTPLNGVLGMAGLLAATKLDATQQAYLGALRDSGELLLSLVNDILDLAKLDSRRLELEAVDTDVERLLQGVCELLSPRAHAAGIEIAWGVQGALPRLRADDGRLRQILFNLAGNAIKLTSSGGVLVTAAKVGEVAGRIRVRFSVKDTGPGVPEDAQARIFEDFVQTEAGARAGGAGLGLAIARTCQRLRPPQPGRRRTRPRTRSLRPRQAG